MHTFSPFLVQLKPNHLRTTMIPPERIQQFIDSNMPESVIVVCFYPPSFFLSSRIIFLPHFSHIIQPSYVFRCCLMFLQFFSFLQNREVLKSALSEFSIAINQAFVNLTQKLCQGVQQQEAHAEGGQAGPSTSKGTREVRSKRKNDILEESLGEIRSDEEDSSSDEDYANFDSCDTEGDEDDENNDGFGDDINSSQIDPRATENEGND
jgi:hypothetical protein